MIYGAALPGKKLKISSDKNIRYLSNLWKVSGCLRERVAISENFPIRRSNGWQNRRRLLDRRRFSFRRFANKMKSFAIHCHWIYCLCSIRALAVRPLFAVHVPSGGRPDGARPPKCDGQYYRQSVQIFSVWFERFYESESGPFVLGRRGGLGVDKIKAGVANFNGAD